jgi:Lrp/AsnC family transcriptional regulator, leucine-responsive regulatory protein
VNTVAIDGIDREILSKLLHNGRATYTELGRDVGLSPHAVADRVRRLVGARIVTGFSAGVDFGAIGRGLDALIDVRLLPTSTPETFEARVTTMGSVREIAFVTGRFDYQLRVACKDADDLDRTVRVLRQEAGAAVTETRIVLRSVAHPPELP